jgi:hypothetical protein
MKEILSHLLLAASILASIAGVAAFVFLFAPNFNIYWLILSPIILALYQTPAVFLYRLWKKRKKREPLAKQ